MKLSWNIVRLDIVILPLLLIEGSNALYITEFKQAFNISRYQKRHWCWPDEKIQSIIIIMCYDKCIWRNGLQHYNPYGSELQWAFRLPYHTNPGNWGEWSARFIGHWVATRMFAEATRKRISNRQLEKTSNGRSSQLKKKIRTNPFKF